MLSVVSRIVSMSGQIEAAHGRPDRRAACSFLVALVAPYPISLINNIPSYNLILAGDDRVTSLVSFGAHATCRHVRVARAS